MGKANAGEVVLKSLAKPQNGEAQITGVRLVGSKKAVDSSWQADGLHIQLPAASYSEIATVLKVTGSNLRDFPTPVAAAPAPAKPIVADEAGTFALEASSAQTHGDGIQVEGEGANSNLGYWDNADDWASWSVNFKAAGTYEVTATVSAMSNETAFEFAIGTSHLTGKVPMTGDWANYKQISLGTITVPKGGSVQVSVKPANHSTWKPMNLRHLVLRKAN